MKIFFIIGLLSIGLCSCMNTQKHADKRQTVSNANDTTACYGLTITDSTYNGKTSVHKEGQQQDSASYILRQFYTEYITEWLRNDDIGNNKIEAIRKQYITRQLFDELQRMYKEGKLDYDPFLEAQDCDKSVLEKLRIEKDTVQANVYRVYLWDNYNQKYKEVSLLLEYEEYGYKIGNILSLPNY